MDIERPVGVAWGDTICLNLGEGLCHPSFQIEVYKIEASLEQLDQQANLRTLMKAKLNSVMLIKNCIGDRALNCLSCLLVRDSVRVTKNVLLSAKIIFDAAWL